ncbi:hypothetical protein EV44_g1237 [Erysiphe necator]|uniref:Uncharacterized protein n=1 Tax=Uncinula necator TaxID=52586 RepID=A0A0B1PG19_UNCNE|nr:hypothetical protein EV44_g1237 [Erysiphe necator]
MDAATVEPIGEIASAENPLPEDSSSNDVSVDLGSGEKAALQKVEDEAIIEQSVIQKSQGEIFSDPVAEKLNLEDSSKDSLFNVDNGEKSVDVGIAIADHLMKNSMNEDLSGTKSITDDLTQSSSSKGRNSTGIDSNDHKSVYLGGVTKSYDQNRDKVSSRSYNKIDKYLGQGHTSKKSVSNHSPENKGPAGVLASFLTKDSNNSKNIDKKSENSRHRSYKRTESLTKSSREDFDGNYSNIEKSNEPNLKFQSSSSRHQKRSHHHDRHISELSSNKNLEQTPENSISYEKRKSVKRSQKSSHTQINNDSCSKENTRILLKSPEKFTHLSNIVDSLSPNESHESTSKLMDKKKKYVVKSAPFVADQKPHVKEKPSKIPPSKFPLLDRVRLSLDGDRPPITKEKDLSRHHSSSERSHQRIRDDRERYRKLAEREARKAKKETEKKISAAQKEVAAEARYLHEKEAEERRLRREKRRKRREEQDRAQDDRNSSTHLRRSQTQTKVSKSKSHRSRDNVKHCSESFPRSHSEPRPEKTSEHHQPYTSSRVKEKEKSRGALRFLWSTAKKVFK